MASPTIPKDATMPAASSLRTPPATSGKPPRLIVAAWNIQRGMFRREIEIRELANQLDILALTETDSVHLSGYKLDNFKVFLPLAKSNKKVRVMILVKEWLAPHVQLRQDLMTEDFSSIWISIAPAVMGKCFNLCAIYREWNANGEVSNSSAQFERIKVFLEQLGKATVGNERVFIMGDINFCSNKWDNKNYPQKSLADEWRAGVAKYGLEHIQLGSTYFSNHPDNSGNFAESALDHFYTNCPETIIETKVLPTSSTDHLPIQANIVTKQKLFKKVITKRVMKNFSAKLFCKDLAQKPWEKLAETENVNEMVEIYTNFINNVLDVHAPIKEIKIRSNYKSGISCSTKKLMNKRDRARKKFSKSNENEKKILHEKYKTLRNKCTALIRKETIENSVRRVERSQSPSEFWKIANEIIKPKTKENITLNIEGKEVTNEEAISKEFNNKFLEKIENLVQGTRKLENLKT